ncbi:MAG: DMT family transporter [Rhodobacteraceae bacterium]|nr:DMT family transporter [Paracoccaceae bacterium]
MNRFDLPAIAMGIAFALMWSSAFSTARIIVQETAPLTALSFRFAISGCLGIGWALALGQPLRLSRGQTKAMITFGICQNAIYLGVNFVAMQWIEASLAAIIASSLPLVVAFLSWLFFGEKVGWLGMAGLCFGIAGVGLIMGVRLDGSYGILGAGLCFAGAVALAIATLTVRMASTGGNLAMVIGQQMLVGCCILAIPAILFETSTLTWSWKFAAAFAYTTIVPGLLATWVWFTLVNRVGPTRASSFHFLNPFFGVAVAAALLGEPFGPTDIIGVVIITAGILAVQADRKRSGD